jgi:hypothetical protein
MRNVTCSFAPGTAGGGGGGRSGFLVVAVLKAFSASLRASRKGVRAMRELYQALPRRANDDAVGLRLRLTAHHVACVSSVIAGPDPAIHLVRYSLRHGCAGQARA